MKSTTKIKHISVASAARRQIFGGGGAPINKTRRRRPQNVGVGGAAGAWL